MIVYRSAFKFDKSVQIILRVDTVIASVAERCWSELDFGLRGASKIDA